MMMSLDQFVFSLPTLAYQEFQRQQEWKHPGTSRVGERDAHQYVGEGDDTITLSGWIAPEFCGDITSLDDLRDMASDGAAYVLVEGTGRIFGEFVITHISEGRTLFYADGLPRRIEFSLSLKRVDRGDRIDAHSGSRRQDAMMLQP
jgi:phage protein U